MKKKSSIFTELIDRSIKPCYKGYQVYILATSSVRFLKNVNKRQVEECVTTYNHRIFRKGEDHASDSYQTSLRDKTKHRKQVFGYKIFPAVQAPAPERRQARRQCARHSGEGFGPVQVSLRINPGVCNAPHPASIVTLLSAPTNPQQGFVSRRHSL